MWALDFLGHGAVDPPARRRLHLRDADGRRRRRAAPHRSGDGARPRPRRIHRRADRRARVPTSCAARSCATDPDSIGGGSAPSSPVVVQPRLVPDAPTDAPDPFALAELPRDVRPPDYVANFARQTHVAVAARHADHRHGHRPARVARQRSSTSQVCKKRRSPRRWRSTATRTSSPAPRSRSMRPGSWATVWLRSPPPSCIRRHPTAADVHGDAVLDVLGARLAVVAGSTFHASTRMPSRCASLTMNGDIEPPGPR